MPGDKATDELAVTATVDASDASLAPASRPGRARSMGTDFTELVAADPAHYAIGDEIARGGMGRIVRARDLRLGRSIAIKELLPGHDDARFEREARITARLEHPSIVSVHEAGRWPTGEPFFAMKLVAGTPLDRHIAAAAGLAERLALVTNVIAVVDALAYAHSEHVIHRDLKPANVLCGTFGETVVIDWGLAKDLTASDADDLAVGPYRQTARPGETVAGAVMGTPAYMPPEQAAGERVDARADVYALGAILYHVLAGVPPYTAQRTEQVLEGVLAAPPPPLAERVPDAPSDLVAIVEKAMARERDARFPTAKEMADELKRFQTGQLVTSHRYTTGELVRRWIRKNRGVVLVGAIAAAALAIVGIASVSRIVSERRRADSQAAVARARADVELLDRARVALDRDPSEAVALLRGLGAGSLEWRAARMIAADAESRGTAFELAAKGRVDTLALSRDGTRLCAGEPGAVEVWDIAAGTSRVLVQPMAQLAVGFAPNGEVLHVPWDGSVRRWNPATGADVIVRPSSDEYGGGSISPDGRHVALFGRERGVLIDLDGKDVPLAGYARGAWSPDGRAFVAYDRSGSGHIDRIDLATGRGTPVGETATALAIATDGVHVWVGDYHGKVIDLADDQNRRPVGHGENPVTALDVLPDGAIVSASSHYTFRAAGDDPEHHVGDYALAISAGAESQIVRLRGHRAEITAMAVTPGGAIASASLDKRVRVWRRGPTPTRLPDDRTTSFVMMTPDHRQLVIVRRDPAVEIYELATGASRRLEIVQPPQPPSDTRVIVQVGDRRIMERSTGSGDDVLELARTRDGRTFVTLDKGGRAVLWDLARGGTIVAEGVHHVAISADGSRIATTSEKGIDLWTTSTLAARHLERDAFVTALALSADGSKLAIATSHGELEIYDGSPHEPLPVEDAIYGVVAFTPDDRQLVAGDMNGNVHFYDLATQAERTREAHGGTATLLVFDADGTRMASAGADGTVAIWKLGAPTPSPQMLRGHTAPVTSIVLDGELALTASDDRTARVWDLATGEGRALVGHADKVVLATRTAGGAFLTIDHDDRIVTYPDDLPHDELGLRVWLAAATNYTAR